MSVCNEIDIPERIKVVLDSRGVTMAELAGSEAQRVRLSRQLNGHGNLTLPVVEMVLRRFPDVSAEWLMRGEGQMDKSEHFAPRVHVTGGGSAFINEHGTHVGVQKSEPIVIPAADDLEKLMRTPEGFMSLRSILDYKDEAIALRDSIIQERNATIADLRNQLATVNGLLLAMTSGKNNK